ncbi:MAG: 50S ribosomal protein L6 [Myxococcota bacterium]
MSRIGKLPIPIPPGVEVALREDRVCVKGPGGELEQRQVPNTRVEILDGQIVVHRDSEEKVARAAHGLMRSLVANMVMGVTRGFEKELEIVGVGYRAEVKGQQLTLSVGFSHTVILEVPGGLEVTAESPTKLKVKGRDKQQVGQFASEIRRVRPPEPYKGKGIRYAGERVRRKVGKSGVGAGT